MTKYVILYIGLFFIPCIICPYILKHSFALSLLHLDIFMFKGHMKRYPEHIELYIINEFISAYSIRLALFLEQFMHNFSNVTVDQNYSFGK